MMNRHLNSSGFVFDTYIHKSLEKSCTFYHKKRHPGVPAV